MIFKAGNQCEQAGPSGDERTTAAECQAAAATKGNNAINYNTDPHGKGVKCRMLRCAQRVAPSVSLAFWESFNTFDTAPFPNRTAGVNITIDLGECGHGGGGSTAVEDVWSGHTLATVSGSSYAAGGIPLHGHAFLRLSKLASAATGTASTGGGSRHTRSYTTHAAVERVALACPAGARIASVSHADAAAACNGRQSCSFVARAKLALTFDCENY
jgi:hypothetical protein